VSSAARGTVYICRFLVAIVDATHSYIKFGLRVSASTPRNSSIISVYYADERPASDHWDSPVSSWTVPSLVGRWSSIIVRAKGRRVSLYVDCDVKAPVDVVVERLPRGLTFDTGSVVYVAQAGPQFAQHFEVHCLYHCSTFHVNLCFMLSYRALARCFCGQ